MTRSISSPKLSLKLTATVNNTLTDASSASASHPNLSYAKTMTNGLGDNQADRAWQRVSATIDVGDQEILDLLSFNLDIGAGAGNDATGMALTLAEVVVLVIVNENAVTADGALEIIPSASEGWNPIGSHTVANDGALYGQGMLAMAQMADVGFPVEANSHRITFKATGAAVTYSVYILGRSDEETSSSSSVSSSSSSSLSASSSSSSSPSSISTSSISTSGSSSSSSSSSLSSISTSSVSSSSSSSSSLSLSSSSSASESSSSLSSV